MISPTFEGVTAFSNLAAAWAYLESLVASGHRVRLVVLMSSIAPLIPVGHDPNSPIPEGPQNEPGSVMRMIGGSYDYSTLNWDDRQQQYCWEGQNNGSSNPKYGQHWRAAFPYAAYSGIPHMVFLVVEIGPEREANAGGSLPRVPWKE